MTIRASTDWAEFIPADEDERHRGYADEMQAMVHERAVATGRLGRAVHLKRHVGVQAELIVGELPDELRVGPFAAPRTWPVYVRFSNSSSQSMHDALPDVRGVAIKLVGVPGPKLLPGFERALTQDFAFVNFPATPFPGPEDLVAFVRAVNAGPLRAVPRLLAELGPRKLLHLLRFVATMPWDTSMATARFFTCAPLRFGDRAVKLDLVPEDAQPGCFGRGRDGLREDLIARLDTGSLRYVLRAQFFVDEATTPIEDCSVEWPTPYHELARLEIPAQDIGSSRGRAIDEYVEALAFNPWHAVAELRPLGAMMRARIHAYPASARERCALGEPDGSETF